MPRLTGRIKRLSLPEQLRSLDLPLRRLSLLSLRLLDGPLTVSQRAEMFGAATTKVSDLSSRAVLVRRSAGRELNSALLGYLVDWLSDIYHSCRARFPFGQRHDRALNSVNAVRVMPHPVL